MITNNIDFLHRVIMSMADMAYEDNVVATGMEEILIGADGEYHTKEEWMSDYIVEHFNQVKLSLLGAIDPEVAIEKILTHKNTVAMRMYALDPGQEFELDNFRKIIRLPGGWGLINLEGATQFIPYSDEFKPGSGILGFEFDRLQEELLNENLDMEDANAQ